MNIQFESSSNHTSLDTIDKKQTGRRKKKVTTLSSQISNSQTPPPNSLIFQTLPPKTTPFSTPNLLTTQIDASRKPLKKQKKNIFSLLPCFTSINHLQEEESRHCLGSGFNQSLWCYFQPSVFEEESIMEECE